MRPSFKDPAIFATLVPDNVPAEQVPKTLAEYVRFCAAERRGRTGKEVLFREDVIELLHAAGYPYAKQNGCGEIAHRVRRRQSGGSGRSSAALPVNGVCGTIRRCTYLKPSSAQADSPSLAPA